MSNELIRILASIEEYKLRGVLDPGLQALRLDLKRALAAKPTPPQGEKRWIGWAVERSDALLYVQYGGDEASAWRTALGWPTADEIADAQAKGARAFMVEIRERKP